MNYRGGPTAIFLVWFVCFQIWFCFAVTDLEAQFLLSRVYLVTIHRQTKRIVRGGGRSLYHRRYGYFPQQNTQNTVAVIYIKIYLYIYNISFFDSTRTFAVVYLLRCATKIQCCVIVKCAYDKAGVVIIRGSLAKALGNLYI